MEPLLALRATIGRLSKAGANLGHRAVVKSSDEFGELANDINHFLDRISHIIEDEAKVLGQVGALNKRLSQVRDQMDDHLTSIRAPLDRLTRSVFTEPTGGAGHAAMQAVLEALDALAERADLPPEARQRLHAASESWSASAEDAVAQGEARIGIAEMHQRLGGFSHFIGEMTALEEKMQAMADEGQRLLKRLQPPAG
jgi:methyl-accepting chemotaxis protein